MIKQKTDYETFIEKTDHMAPHNTEICPNCYNEIQYEYYDSANFIDGDIKEEICPNCGYIYEVHYYYDEDSSDEDYKDFVMNTGCNFNENGTLKCKNENSNNESDRYYEKLYQNLKNNKMKLNKQKVYDIFKKEADKFIEFLLDENEKCCNCQFNSTEYFGCDLLAKTGQDFKEDMCKVQFFENDIVEIDN